MNYNDDALTHAVNQTDLPRLVANLYPESGAKPGKQDTVYAVWRGNSRTPSFSLHRHPDSHVWFYSDKATGESGNAYDFLTEIFGVSPEEASKILKENAGIPDDPAPAPRKKRTTAAKSFEPKPLGPEEANRFLSRATTGTHRPKALARRGFKGKDLDAYRVVADGNDALIPLFSPEGELLNVKRRIAEPKGDMKYRYEYSGQGSPPWVSPNFVEGDPVLVVEGELNGMIAHAVLYEQGSDIAVMGVAGSGGRLYLENLKGREVYVYADGDDPGEKARERWIQEVWYAGADKVYRTQPLIEGDFCDSAAHGREVLSEQLRLLLDSAQVAYSQEDRRIAAFTISELRRSAERFVSGEVIYSTGFKSLDRKSGGLPESDLAVVAALPSFGKSSMLYHMLLAYLDQDPKNNKALLFTPDASPGAIVRRITTRRSGVPTDVLRYSRDVTGGAVTNRYGTIEKARQAWWDVFEDAVVDVSKRLIMSEKQDLAEVKQDIRQHVEDGVGMVGFDYIQLFEEERREADGQKKAIKDLKSMATSTLKVPMIMAAQLAKYKFGAQRKSGIPLLSDIEGIGTYHQVANQVYLIYNQKKYMEDFGLTPDTYKGYSESEGELARVIVAKNKEGEAGGFVFLKWHPKLVEFSDAYDS